MTTPSQRPIALAITGASGGHYALRLLQSLIDAVERVYLMMSEPGQIVISMETELKLPARPGEMQRFLTEYYCA